MTINRNQKDLDALLAKAISEVKAAGLKPGVIDETIYLTRAKKTYAKCETITGGFAISLSKFFKDNPLEEVMQTLVHEILHTLPNCMNHGAEWKNAAAVVNSKYGYNVSRLSSMEMANLTAVDIEIQRRYTVVCLDCGNELYRERKSKLITHTHNYTCGKCGGELQLKEDN